MNLLAHALLSPPDPAILVGNLTADWVKGRARHALPGALQSGMALHQRIDTFTDLHPLVERCGSLLEPRWGRYSPVLVDIFFDHALCSCWREFCPVPRATFTADVCAALQAHCHLLPARAQYAVHALIADDWFTCYATFDGLALSLTRISSRLNHGIELAPAVADYRANLAAFTAAFREFFPQLRRHVLPWPPAPPPPEVH